MSKSAMIRARIEPDVKEHAEVIFRELGLNPTEAITLFYQYVGICKGLPFDVRLPNEETRQTFEATDKGMGLTRYGTMDEMFDDLDSD
ncbi:type II toxin-antitoxin system RelB/DinJ family antitoxin [Endozoicomonas sp. SCSIO W0465]|uniref:type II toxin-antitoxin system RelB/DinJ family antitoxin n=1 Tax=Endozoicomonas sp. SCSIO W0465 TaxID=2918516 RepID=UPI0020759452|nr:type II toxin-antitoxin system RelB/DinJ family antitoxin [Endozoicomonas sp. SCSIO W0465]USE39158.1 type II toxin-antitoxin system RelB/DinJ family antitoxin [Endozoicomonas sp. SCSIO W0465]